MTTPALSPELIAMSQEFDLSADELTATAKKAAKACHRTFDNWQKFNVPDEIIQRQLRRISKKHHITLPSKAGLQEVMNRLCEPCPICTQIQAPQPGFMTAQKR
jgi:hypothetical protein